MLLTCGDAPETEKTGSPDDRTKYARRIARARAHPCEGERGKSFFPFLAGGGGCGIVMCLRGSPRDVPAPPGAEWPRVGEDGPVSCPVTPWPPDPASPGVSAYVDAHGGSQRLAGRFPADVLVRAESVKDWDAVAQIRASVIRLAELDGGFRGPGWCVRAAR